jgi:hypothetical protein
VSVVQNSRACSSRYFGRNRYRCKRYSKRMRWTAKFIEHLPTCKDCEAVIAYLNRESEITLYF